MNVRVLSIGALIVAAVLRPTGSATGDQQDGAQTRPRLIVMIVVDQMRADYLDVFANRWKHGFATLRSEGAVFDRAEYPYMNTVTCPGHATIGTGTFPHVHGMILNGWWDHTRRAPVSCTDDASSPAISYGEQTKSTFSGRLIRVPTFADELRAQRPGSRVVSLSLKPRSAIGLAGHGGTVVTWTDDLSASFVTSRAFSPTPIETVRDFLHQTPYVADAKKSGSFRHRTIRIGTPMPTRLRGRQRRRRVYFHTAFPSNLDGPPRSFPSGRAVRFQMNISHGWPRG